MQATRSNLMWTAGATVLGILCGVLLLFSGMQQNGIERRGLPAPLFRRWPGHDVLRLQAERDVIAGHADAGARLARASLRTGPLDRRALRALALDGTGRSAAALRLMTFAGTLSWHDAATQTWLMRDAFLKGDAAGGARHVNALLRGDPTDAAGLIGIELSTQTDAGQDAIARRLALHPPWRGTALDLLPIETPLAAAATASLFQAMRVTRAPPTPHETSNLVDKLVAAGHGPIALAYWLGAGGALPAGGELIDDPDFRMSAAALRRGELGPSFGWTGQGGDGVEIVGDRDPAGRPALAIEDDGDGSDRFVHRPLVLPPGRYLLSYAVSNGTAPSDAIRAELDCPHASAQPKADPPSAVRRETDLLVHMRFEVPAGCATLRAGFSLASRDSGQPETVYLRAVRLQAEP